MRGNGGKKMAPKTKLKKTARKRREKKLVERGVAHIRSSFNPATEKEPGHITLPGLLLQLRVFIRSSCFAYA